MQRNRFNIRLVHILGTTRVFEGARIDQAFLTLAHEVNAIFPLHTRREGIKVVAIWFGEIKHSHLRLDKPYFLSRGQSVPRLLSRISRIGIFSLGGGRYPLILAFLLTSSRRSTNSLACRWDWNTSLCQEPRYKLIRDDRWDSLRLSPLDLFL